MKQSGQTSNEDKWKPGPIPVDDLRLDAKNPRLILYNIDENASQDEITQVLWERMAVEEVALSIAKNGYWDYETIFVAEENGRNVVIEGNRRLAAIKILLDGNLRRKLKLADFPSLSSQDRKKIEKGLPAIVLAKREDIWKYLGFKHVHGPAKWSSYAKAQYIAMVHKKTKASLVEIAEQIGDQHQTVQRLYWALMVIEQAEKSGVWKRDFSYKHQLSFSHLMTGLQYNGFRSFLNLRDKREESRDPVDPKRMNELGELCAWLWGDSRTDTPPVIKSQNPDLRRLDQILSDQTQAAVRVLRKGGGLDAAYEVSKGEELVFAEALQDAKQALIKAQGRVSVGFRGEEHLLRLAEEIGDMANDLLSNMHKKSDKGRRSQ